MMKDQASLSLSNNYEEEDEVSVCMSLILYLFSQHPSDRYTISEKNLFVKFLSSFLIFLFFLFQIELNFVDLKASPSL